MAREKAERDKINEKKRKVKNIIFLGRACNSNGKCNKIYSELVFGMEGSRRRKEKEEKEEESCLIPSKFIYLYCF